MTFGDRNVQTSGSAGTLMRSHTHTHAHTYIHTHTHSYRQKVTDADINM